MLSTDELLLVLRLLASALLLAFMGALGYFLWRDTRNATPTATLEVVGSNKKEQSWVIVAGAVAEIAGYDLHFRYTPSGWVLEGITPSAACLHNQQVVQLPILLKHGDHLSINGLQLRIDY